MDDSADELRRLRERIANLERELADSQAAHELTRHELRRLKSASPWAFRASRLAVRLRGALAPRGSWRSRMVKAVWIRSQRRKLESDRLSARQEADSLTPTSSLPCLGFGGEPGLVSVILPVYNQANLLRESIQSVLDQTYASFELIIVNDGSKDGVEAVLAEFAHDPRVRPLTQANQKLPKALSNGFEFARGEFWTWTSADNLMAPEQLARLVDHLRSRPFAAMVFANYWAIDDRGAILTNPDFRPHNRPDPPSGIVILPRSTNELNIVQDNFIGPCFLYRGWVGKLVGDYDPGMLGVEDYDYWMRINAVWPIERLESDEPLYWYRVHDNSLSGRAVELRIHERNRWLIDHEIRRAGFRRQPWTILIDPNLRRDFANVDFSPHRWRFAETEDRITSDDGDKVLRFVADPDRLTSDQDELVVIWHETEESAYSAIAEPNRLAIAADESVIQRLSIVGVRGYLVESPQAALALAVAWADGVAFDRSHPRRADRSRRLPDVFRERPLKIHVFSEPAWERLKAMGLTDSSESWRSTLDGADLVCAAWPDCASSLTAIVDIPKVIVLTADDLKAAPEIAETLRADQTILAYLCANRSATEFADSRLNLNPDKLILAADCDQESLINALSWLFQGGAAVIARTWVRSGMI